MNWSPTMTIAVALPPRQSATAFARAAWAKAVAATTGSKPEEVLKRRYPRDEKALTLITRADATPGAAATSGWASELVRNEWREFLVDLAPLSAAARLIEMGLQTQMPNGVEALKYPTRATPTAATFV